MESSVMVIEIKRRGKWGSIVLKDLPGRTTYQSGTWVIGPSGETKERVRR